MTSRRIIEAGTPIMGDTGEIVAVAVTDVTYAPGALAMVDQWRRPDGAPFMPGEQAPEGFAAGVMRAFGVWE